MRIVALQPLWLVLLQVLLEFAFELQTSCFSSGMTSQAFKSFY